MIDIQLSQILGTGTSIHDLQQLIIKFHLEYPYLPLNPINLHLNYLISADINSRILFDLYRNTLLPSPQNKGITPVPTCMQLTSAVLWKSMAESTVRVAFLVDHQVGSSPHIKLFCFPAGFDLLRICLFCL